MKKDDPTVQMPVLMKDVQSKIVVIREQSVIVDAAETEYLRSKISTANVSSKSRVLPKVFTEKGLYMLATILKSKAAVKYG